jgi:hypothetical protein
MCAAQKSAKIPSQQNLTGSFSDVTSIKALSPVPTYVERFSSGETIELVDEHSNGSVQLHFSDGQHATISPQIEFDGCSFYAANLSRSIRQIVTVPTKSADFHSTMRLFQQTQDRALISLAALIPPKIGILMSRMIRSGFNSSAFSIASWPLAPSPQISMSLREVKIARTPSLTAS